MSEPLGISELRGVSESLASTQAGRRALITGITGQDGCYLAELLLARGYRVEGLSRRPAAQATADLRRVIRIADNDLSRLAVHNVDPGDPDQVFGLVERLQPDEVYHLGAQSHVGRSFEAPFETLDANARASLAILDAARRLREQRPIRVFQASTGQLFGMPADYPQTEQTPFRPRSPYACSKAYAFDLAVCYRETYGVFVCNGILYNHESPRRGLQYVTRKITHAVARIAAGDNAPLVLAGLDGGRDWGYAPEYVEAMWLMLQHDQPDDYVIATNEWHSLRQLLERAFGRIGRDWRDHVQVSADQIRPAETGRLQGDHSKALATLGWRPRTSFDALIDLMVDTDLRERSEAARP